MGLVREGSSGGAAHISLNRPPRDSKYEYTNSESGGYCLKCDVLYESVSSTMLSKGPVPYDDEAIAEEEVEGGVASGKLQH